ncbi:MAG: hypothetical protein IT490_10870 [Candidatus Contendobacter sp.]|nr:hypothetical protein [Opitutaceae bacterium]MCC7221213.1 hypothetical protein [Candidatus Contendobacter sp.]
MNPSPILEVRRFQRRGEPFALYYAPDIAIRAHDHNYLLRLISDRVAARSPTRFVLLPQFRSLELH